MPFFTLAFGFSSASRLSALRSPQSEPQEEQFPLQELIGLTLLFLSYVIYYMPIFSVCQPRICAAFSALGRFPLLHQVHEDGFRLFLFAQKPGQFLIIRGSGFDFFIQLGNGGFLLLDFPL